MATEEDWETKAQVDACRAELGISETKLAQWRSEGLLPPAHQVPHQYRGSETLFPKGSCAQMRAAHSLMREKSLFSFVRYKLWWQGFVIGDEYWRPGLVKAANFLDRLIPLVGPVLSKPVGLSSTQADKIAAASGRGTLLSRPFGRLKPSERATFLGVIGEATDNDSADPFSAADGVGELSAAEVLKRGLGLDGVDSALVFGASLRLEHALPQAWRQVGRAISRGNFESIAMGPSQAIEQARDQTRMTLQASAAAYRALSEIYPKGARGFWLANWIHDHLQTEQATLLILLMARLREGDAVSSEEHTALLLSNSVGLELFIQHIKALRSEYPEYADVLTPAKLRRSVRDKKSQDRFTCEIDAAKLKIAARLGSGHVVDVGDFTLTNAPPARI